MPLWMILVRVWCTDYEGRLLKAWKAFLEATAEPDAKRPKVCGGADAALLANEDFLK